MAKHEAMPTRAKEDLDDMVYVSDNDDQSQPFDKEPGMIPKIKHLYDGERDSRGPYTWTEKCPDDLPELEETEETARYAMLIRNAKCYDGHKQLAISSILVQSPLLKTVLSWVLKDYPSMAPDLDRLEIVSPFRPFVHRWQRLTEALSYEQDPETKSHIQLFHDALKHDLEITLEARDDFFAHKAVTFHCLWMIFEPGEIVMTTLNGHRQAFKLKNAICVSGRHENSYRLECELIRWDGGEFGWAKHVFEISEFDGMKKITDLEVFPLQFHSRAEKIRKQLVAKGKIYEKLQGQHHKQYRGIALDVAQPFYVCHEIPCIFLNGLINVL